MDTGHDSSNLASACCNLSVSSLLSCHHMASSSGPWAQRPPPVWPVTLLPTGQRAPQLPVTVSCLGRALCLLWPVSGSITKAPFTRGHCRGTGKGCGALLPVGIKTPFLFCCVSPLSAGRQGGRVQGDSCLPFKVQARLGPGQTMVVIYSLLGCWAAGLPAGVALTSQECLA